MVSIRDAYTEAIERNGNKGEENVKTPEGISIRKQKY